MTGSPGSQEPRRRACIFCGSSLGHRSLFREAAVQTARLLVQQGYDLVYGGGRIGLMGVVADTVLEAGGHVTGVIPRFLASREIMHAAVTDLHLVDSMHARKALMAEFSDVFIALPGGLGTYDELCEILTWAQLGLHSKPVGLLNTDGFFDGLVQQMDRAVQEGFCRPEHRRLLVDASQPDELFAVLANYRPVGQSKWLSAGQE